MMPPFLDLPASRPETADGLLLPLPFEGTVSYGRGTAGGPEAIWQASTQVEPWDEEIGCDLDRLRLFSHSPLSCSPGDSVESYLRRVQVTAADLQRHGGLVFGIGGEHGLSPPLVRAAVDDPGDLSAVTVVQFDAHPDLRDEYEGTPHSHACAMRRLVERGARILAVGIRSADREEFAYGRDGGRVRSFFARQLAEDPEAETRLLQALSELEGAVYLTIDVDALEVHLCPATGTPQPGGLGWWQILRYLRTLLLENRRHRLIGADLVETVPQPGTRVNEFTAARLVCKVLAYHAHRNQ